MTDPQNDSPRDISSPVSLPPQSSNPIKNRHGVNDPATESLSDSTIRNAIELYKARMRTSNKKFMDDRINEIASMDLTDRQKLDMLARFWFSRLETQWPVHYSIHGNEELGQREMNATSIEDVRHFEIPCTEGVEPATLISEDAREAFLDELENFVNEDAGFDDERRIRFPEELQLRSFLKFSNGVGDLDLRDAGLCGWDIVFDVKSEGVTTQSLRSRARAIFKKLLVNDELQEEQGMFKIEERLDVKTGFATGEGSPSGGGCYWYSYYLFCREWKDDEMENEGKEERYDQCDGWAWRIVFDCSEVTDEDDTLIFDNIPDFLEWSSTWADRNAEKIMEKVQGVYDMSDFFVGKDLVRSFASRS